LLNAKYILHITNSILLPEKAYLEKEIYLTSHEHEISGTYIAGIACLVLPEFQSNHGFRKGRNDAVA
jgi:hypothetical protein